MEPVLEFLREEGRLIETWDVLKWDRRKRCYLKSWSINRNMGCIEMRVVTFKDIDEVD